MHSEQEHRQKMEKMALENHGKETNKGQNYAFSIMIAMIGLAFIAGLLGNNILAGIIMASYAIGVVRDFINGRQS